METFTTITVYHWIALGVILLAAQTMAAARFLLGAGAAALGMGLALWLVPDMAAGWQLGIFGIGAALATLACFRLFRDT